MPSVARGVMTVTGLCWGGTNGDGVKVYERVDGGRSLLEVAALPKVKASTAFLWLQGA
jgi:hypothetical protein